ncbi:histidine kinase [Limnoraphis robusta]|uniref:Adaptive-response sensory-kinase SasA n=1 Tax=Limnoraphis robusta CCNP1315 TaxID=3110306 RepID=A0ABU5TS99_9CYAN|nr:histidine kinase [Limnoraphis robusta]MEA5517654.1 histidine kinase [Limnoraphis robusta CCNP1315]MEA5544461.1 histidine kinase [Limnoraphis robusta CCNP1324]
MQVFPEKSTNPEACLQLLLFADQRPSSKEQIRQIRQFLEKLDCEEAYELQVIDVGQQPYLAEYFKLVATPAIVRIFPEPRHILAGSDLVAQLEHWWPRWQLALEECCCAEPKSHPQVSQVGSNANSITSVAYVSELIKLSDEVFRLKQEKEQLTQQLNFKDRIIEILAHDLRSPLTAASLALETLLASNQKAQEKESPQITQAFKERLVQQARSQLRIIDRMITDLLQTATGPSAKLLLQPNQLDLAQFCKEILAEFKGQLQSKSLQLQTDIPSDIPCVYADQERIRQVIVNLLDNALKYTPKGGSLQVSILHRTTQKIQVSICDSGPGIPEENRDRIFQDRFRLERDESQDGYGIGLSLCKRIIRAHYGQIWVDSSPNKGSCFHFTLPVYHY